MSKLFLYRFRFLGAHEKCFAIRAPTWNTDVRGPMGAHFFENQVYDWLFSNTDGEFHMSTGNAAGYPNVPALANGSSLCVLFESKTDLLKFATEFPVRHLEGF
jgi:hypothetical protein